MKFLYYSTLVVAFAFGMNNAKAANTSGNDNTSVEMTVGSVEAAYNETSETIVLRMVSDSKADRVMVVLAGRGGAIVFKEKVVVSKHGTILEIPMFELTDGNYFLRVKGSGLNYSGRFRKK